MMHANGNEEVGKFVRLLISQDFSALEGAKIAYLLAEKPTKSRGREQHVSIKRFPEKLLAFFPEDVEYDFLIEITTNAWNDETRREPLLAECLSRLEREDTVVKKGRNKGETRTKWTLNGADAEVFPDLLRRYGPYKPELEDVVESVLWRRQYRGGYETGRLQAETTDPLTFPRSEG